MKQPVGGKNWDKLRMGLKNPINLKKLKGSKKSKSLSKKTEKMMRRIQK